MGDRAAQDHRVQQARQGEIVDELAAAAQQAQVFQPLDRAADIGIRRSRSPARHVMALAFRTGQTCRYPAFFTGVSRHVSIRFRPETDVY